MGLVPANLSQGLVPSRVPTLNVVQQLKKQRCSKTRLDLNAHFLALFSPFHQVTRFTALNRFYQLFPLVITVCTFSLFYHLLHDFPRLKWPRATVFDTIPNTILTFILDIDNDNETVTSLCKLVSHVTWLTKNTAVTHCKC